MGLTITRISSASRGERLALPVSGLILFLVAIPVLGPLIIAGIVRSVFLCTGPENSPHKGTKDTLYGFAEANPVCASGGAWLYAGAPTLTFVIVGLAATSMIVLYKWPRSVWVTVAICVLLLPWPYVLLLHVTGDWL